MKQIRVMAERAFGREGYVVCAGDVPLPARRCEWRVVGRRRHGPDAVARMEELPSSKGRAVLRLSASALVFVNRAGEVLQDNRPVRKSRGVR